MRISLAAKTMWGALWHPTVTSVQSRSNAVAVFALAVIVLTATQLVVSYCEASNSSITDQVRQSSIIEKLRDREHSAPTPDGAVPNENVFTVQLGTALITTVIGLAVAALAFALLFPFLTNQPANYFTASGAVSAAALVGVIRTLLYLAIHLATGSLQWGLHAGVFVDIVQQPFLFTWLSKIDPLLWWEYVVMAMVLSNSVGLHYRYGLVIGSLVYTVMIIGVGSLALFGFITLVTM